MALTGAVILLSSANSLHSRVQFQLLHDGLPAEGVRQQSISRASGRGRTVLTPTLTFGRVLISSIVRLPDIEWNTPIHS